MKVKNEKQIEALKQAASSKHEKTLQRVIDTIQAMKEKEIPINFQSLSKYANVSKTWLYANKDIKLQVENIRNSTNSSKRSLNLYELVDKKDKTIVTLKQKIKLHEATIIKLRKQLEVVYGELYKQNYNN